jgi:hypothetical protein
VSNSAATLAESALVNIVERMVKSPQTGDALMVALPKLPGR